MMNRAGHSFERSAILEWLGRGSGQCPLTRLPMKLSDLVHNRALQRKIEQWIAEKEQNKDSCGGESESNDCLDSAGLHKVDELTSFGLFGPMIMDLSATEINEMTQRGIGPRDHCTHRYRHHRSANRRRSLPAASNRRSLPDREPISGELLTRNHRRHQGRRSDTHIHTDRHSHRTISSHRQRPNMTVATSA